MTKDHKAKLSSKPGTQLVEAVWRILDSVKDPEIPVLSIRELGVLRDVQIEASGVTVVITPTYSGCPAIELIQHQIVEVLRTNGIDNVQVRTCLSPAWSSEWLSNEGRIKLQAYGIAPPINGTRACPGSSVVPCPRCHSRHTHRISEFGSTACKALFKCDDCLEPFDYFKCI